MNRVTLESLHARLFCCTISNVYRIEKRFVNTIFAIVLAALFLPAPHSTVGRYEIARCEWTILLQFLDIRHSSRLDVPEVHQIEQISI